MTMDPNNYSIHEILRRLPHRYPILLVDRVLSVEDNRILAIKNVSINEPQFVGHFPHRPVMPGVMILEAMAQTATLLATYTAGVVLDEKSVVYLAGVDNARFKRPVEPGDQLLFDVHVIRNKAGIYKFGAKATVAGELAAEAELMCTMRRIE